MTQAQSSRAETIRKLLAKAEANGVTPDEADAYSSKAAELMITWGIEEALIRDEGDRLRDETVMKMLYTPLVPITYSHEYSIVVCCIARAFTVEPLLHKTRSSTGVMLIGFETDVHRVIELADSIVRQCTMQLGPWYARTVRDWHSGTDKYRMRRGFISGFATGVKQRLTVARDEAVAATSGALVLVDKKARVDQWLKDNMRTKSLPGRSYDPGSHGAGYAAGLKTNTDSALGNGRKAIGR